MSDRYLLLSNSCLNCEMRLLSHALLRFHFFQKPAVTKLLPDPAHQFPYPRGSLHSNFIDSMQLLLLTQIARVESALEALRKLLTLVGQKLSENAAAQTHMGRCSKELDSLSMDRFKPSRIRLMIQSLTEARQSNWKQRRGEAKEKKLSEVDADIEREEREKQEVGSGRF